MILVRAAALVAIACATNLTPEKVSTYEHDDLCAGFAPKNDMNIPVPIDGLASASGLSEGAYNAAIDWFERVATEKILGPGQSLKVNRKWSSGEVNAFAYKYGPTMFIDLHGGLARHPYMTMDGLIMVACHELGHHLGGAPIGRGNMAVEGQSDYYATLKCFRQMFSDDENSNWVNQNTAEDIVVESCGQSFSDAANQYACERAFAASLAISSVLADVSNRPAVSFDQHDDSEVEKTYGGHPDPQCRLDTYTQGAVCDRPVGEMTSPSDYRQGTCTEEAGYSFGYRPHCWFSAN